MPYTHEEKSSGQLIRSADWNNMGRELMRLEADKVNRAGDTIKGPLSVTGRFDAGNSDLYFTKTDHTHTGQGNGDGMAAIENAKDFDALMILGRAHAGGRRIVKLWDYLEVNGELRVTGPTTFAGAGTFENALTVKAGLEVGADLKVNGGRIKNSGGFGVIQMNANDWLRINPDSQYPGIALYKSAAIGEGGLAIGDWSQLGKGELKVTGTATFNSAVNVAGALGFGAATRQMINLWNADYGIGIQNSTQYFRTGKNFAWFKGGSHDNGELIPGTGGVAQMVLKDGSLGVGTDNPVEKLEVKGSIKADGTLYAGGNPVVYENFEIYLRGSAFDSSEGNNTFLKVANYSLGMDNARGLNTVILTPAGKFKAKNTFDAYGNAAQWNAWADWVNASAVNGDVVATATFDALQNAPKGGSAETLLRNIGASESFSAVKGHPRSPYALLFVYGHKAIEISNSYKGPNAHIKTTYYNLFSDITQGGSFLPADNPNRQRMYPDSPLIYQDIFAARDQGVISKLGNPFYDDTTYRSSNPWQARPIIRYGGNNEADGNGMQVNIPSGYDTLWVRLLGDRWNVVKAYFLDGNKEDLGLWAGGYRATNCYCPDGSLSDGFYFSTDSQNRTAHQWLPIPVRRSGQLALISKPNTASEFWVSGIAFSRNPWAHATQSAVAYHWKINGGTDIKWNTHIWNDDVLAEITAKSNSELKVPVVPSNRDKLLYIVEHNNNWNGTMHTGITVNGQPIERFLATYDNPFARHWNSKFYERYIAARIPSSLIPADAKWLNVKIDMSLQNNSIYFREIGSHDFDIP